MWNPFVKLKHYLFGKSRTTSISDQIVGKRQSTLSQYKGKEPKLKDLSAEGEISAQEFVQFFVKTGLDYPGQVNTYFSETGGGVSVEGSVDIGKLLGVGVEIPKSCPVSGKAGISAEVAAGLGLKAAKGTLLSIDFQPDLAGKKGVEEKSWQPVALSQLNGWSGQINAKVSASFSIGAEASLGIKPVEAVELNAFDAKANLFEAEASASYKGKMFIYNGYTQFYQRYPTDASMYDALARDISVIVDDKKKITKTIDTEKASTATRSAELPVFSGWMQATKAEASMAMFSVSASVGTAKVAYDKWASVTAALLDIKASAVKASAKADNQRLSYTISTPADGNGRIEHQVMAQSRLSMVNLALFSLQLSAATVKASFFDHKKGDSKKTEMIKTEGKHLTSVISDFVKRKSKEYSPALEKHLYDKTKTMQNTSFAYSDTVTLLSSAKKRIAGCGYICGQSVEPTTVNRFAELIKQYDSLGDLGLDTTAFTLMTDNNDPDCPAANYGGMTTGLQGSFASTTVPLKTVAEFKQDTKVKVGSRKVIAKTDKALAAYRTHFEELQKKLPTANLSRVQALSWADDIDVLLGLLVAVENALMTWCSDKKEKAATHERSEGVATLISLVDAAKHELYSYNKNLLLFAEVCRLKTLLTSLAAQLSVDKTELMTFFSGVNDVAKDSLAKASAFLIEAAFTTPLDKTGDEAVKAKTLQSIHLRYRMADAEKTETTLFKLGFSIGVASAKLGVEYFDQYKSEGIISLYTRWFGDDADKYNGGVLPERFVPPALLITE